MKQQSLPNNRKHNNFLHLYHEPLWKCEKTDTFVQKAVKLKNLVPTADQLALSLIRQHSIDFISADLINNTTNIYRSAKIYSILCRSRAENHNQSNLDQLIRLMYPSIDSFDYTKVKLIMKFSTLIEEVLGDVTFAYGMVYLTEDEIHFMRPDLIEKHEEKFLRHVLKYLAVKGAYPSRTEWQESFDTGVKHTFVMKGIFREHSGSHVALRA